MNEAPYLISSASKIHTEMSIYSPMKKLNLNSNSFFGHSKITKGMHAEYKNRITKYPAFTSALATFSTHTKNIIVL